MKTLRQVAEKVQGLLGIGVGKAEPYNFMLYRSAFIFLVYGLTCGKAVGGLCKV